MYLSFFLLLLVKKERSLNCNFFSACMFFYDMFFSCHFHTRSHRNSEGRIRKFYFIFQKCFIYGSYLYTYWARVNALVTNLQHLWHNDIWCIFETEVVSYIRNITVGKHTYAHAHTNTLKSETIVVVDGIHIQRCQFPPCRSTVRYSFPLCIFHVYFCIDAMLHGNIAIVIKCWCFSCCCSCCLRIRPGREFLLTFSIKSKCKHMHISSLRIS